ncbi:uncharacterized protein LOC121906424 [Thunnus maccoyii]|uniref:uncharacterized protein LOC121906424 n=1 Tax=Thunnus maccoyii TaxID=8240 RepID=UPI001C4A9EB1|nr:uncharacterized protein LOC121906424 [Thunnus maccoyii]
MRRVMMVFVHVAVAVLSLLSVGQSAPVTSCESLIQQIEIQGRDQLLGKWMSIAESTNVAAFKLLTEMFAETCWVKITTAKENNAIDVFQAQKMSGRCFTLTSKMTLENNTLSMVHPFSVSEVFLRSGCPDCLVLQAKYTIGRSTYTGLQLLSRRAKVTAAEMEEFKKQVECLNLLPPTILDPEKGFCPDESTIKGTGTIDLTDVSNHMNSESVSLLENVINSGGEMLVETISSRMAGLKEN